MIQVGQVLDKYELLERVGQGGMAIVYRGLDRSLKRTVAIKVLHKHLADYQEARDRFEREAQAVAKLRHENILEIYDYAARTEAEAYIVTEFIDGQTLKQFITARPIGFPEVGAMVLLQVCRALAHAHAAKILHRDVKPENIMIRCDGVVKLMDFGISHMVDLERLTVTGQLLGSPAYMAPEHVEGRPLDFRTDVFAAGIVLYQLTVGKLPFEGKNPHEVLKRIAECKFLDPRQANPRIGNRLGKIILKAMAADPTQRYPAIGEMVLALDGYLEESGVATDKVAAELSRYFKSPASYEQAFKDRLVDHLVQRGETLLDDDQRSAALDVFDRVLTVEPRNARVVKILDGIQRRRTIRNAVAVVIAAGFIGGASILVDRQFQPPDEDTGVDVAARGDEPVDVVKEQRMAKDDRPPPVPMVMPAGVDAAVVAVVDASAGSAVVAVDTDAAVAAPPPSHVLIRVGRWENAQLAVGDEPMASMTSDTLFRTIAADTVVHVLNPCCGKADVPVRLGQAEVDVELELLPAYVTPHCKLPGATVIVDGQAADLDKDFRFAFKQGTLDTDHAFEVIFEGPGSDNIDPTPQKITVGPHKREDATCVSH